MVEQQFAGVERFFFKGWAVTGKEQPVGDFVAQQFDGAERAELLAERGIGGVDDFGEDKPDAVVLWRFGVVPQHADDAIAEVDGESGKHGADLGFEGREGFQNKSMRRLFARGLDGLSGAGHAASG